MAHNNDTPILKDLGVVVKNATERYQKEYVWQDVLLNDTFKKEYSRYLKKKKCHAIYHEHTTVVVTRNAQYLFIDNEWFAIASYFVDFCTELLTYQEYYLKICDYLIKDPLTFAKKLRKQPSESDRAGYYLAARQLLSEDFPNHPDIDTAVYFLWRFATDYKWWYGSKTVNRGDFYVSAVLKKLNVVNASSSYIAEIIHSYADDFTLRRLVDSINYFTVEIQKKDFTPDEGTIVKKTPVIKADYGDVVPSQISISISAASLERFRSQE